MKYLYNYAWRRQIFTETLRYKMSQEYALELFLDRFERSDDKQ